MKELDVEIKSRFGKLKGILSTPDSNTGSAIIFVNEYGKNFMENQIATNAARELCDNGFAFLRYNSKGRGSDEETFAETDLHEEVSSLEAAIDFLKSNGYDNIGLMGHGLGGIDVILVRKDNVKSIVMFDPSDMALVRKLDLREAESKKFAEEIADHGYAYDKKWDNALGKKMWENWRHLDVTEYIQNIKCPTLLIAAGKGQLTDYIKKVHKKLRCKKKFIEIKDAGHKFDGLVAERQLISETSKWFKEWL